jgi:hypothetical protein
MADLSNEKKDKLLDDFVKHLRTNLEKANVKIDSDSLKKAVNEAHQGAVGNCEGCANGWHW